MSGWLDALLRRGPEARRLRALRRVASGPLADHLAAAGPDPGTPLDRLPLLAVDLETTGLDPRRDEILSIGWVPVDGGEVVLGGAGRVVVREGGGLAGVGQSAVVHGITDDDLAHGMALEDAVGALLHALAGRVLLAHYAVVETRFIGAACRRSWGVEPPFVVVDTLELERRALARGGSRHVDPGALRLAAARARRGLPPYPLHEALTDALACAELYLAQRAELEHTSPETTLTLRQVVA